MNLILKIILIFLSNAASEDGRNEYQGYLQGYERLRSIPDTDADADTDTIPSTVSVSHFGSVEGANRIMHGIENHAWNAWNESNSIQFNSIHFISANGIVPNMNSQRKCDLSYAAEAQKKPNVQNRNIEKLR